MLLRIREWRQHFHLSQAALASDCGLSREMISAIETGRHKADTDQLQLIADGFGLRVSDLLDERPCPGCPYRQPRTPDPEGKPEPPTPAAGGDHIITHTKRARQLTETLLHRLSRTVGLLVLLAGEGV